MFVSPRNWSSYLTAAAQPHQEGSGSLICQITEADNSRIEVLTQEQYRHFFDHRSKWDTTCRKLTFREIVSVTEALFNCGTARDIAATEKGPRGLIWKLDVSIQGINAFSTEALENFCSSLNKCNQAMNEFRSIATNVQKISQRSLERRTIEKTKSIWGLIKWYVWLYFFDQSGRVKILTRDLVPLYKNAQDSVKERLLLNIDAFEEAIHVDSDKRTDFGDLKTRDKFNTPKEVKKHWLTVYSEDKYHETVSEAADTYRKHVITLLSFWEAIIKIEKNENVDANLDSFDGTARGPLFLE